jgi:hypothetical protein
MLYTVTYEGIDMLGKLVVGQGTPINGVYLEFQNGGTIPSVNPDPADGRSYYAALETGTGDKDYLRIPLSNVPVLSSTDLAKFVSNKLTVFAMSTGQTVGRGGHTFNAAYNSTVFGMALVCIEDVDDASLDKVFSRSYDFSPVLKEVGNEISVSMAHVFGESMISGS